jgi:UDP-N-acetyl-alpha-D-quinovosamine dehydrogenase
LSLLLITGASGFVGRAVCVNALSLGFRVRGTHRSTGSAGLVPAQVEKFQVPSIDRKTDWSRALDGVSAVVHLAGRVHIISNGGEDALAMYREVNTVGTERLARMAANVGVRRFVYVSTIKVNGEQTLTAPFLESDIPRPKGGYAVSKWESEQILRRIEAERGLDVVILRPPLVYGEGVGANFYHLLRLVEKRIPLPLMAIANRRSFIYVKNLADAILTSATHPKARGQTFLVSDGDDISTPELIRRISEAMELPARMFRCSARLLGVAAKAVGKSAEANRLLSSLVIDSTKIRYETSWIPRYTMLQGLKETAQWYLASKPMIPEISDPPGGLVHRLDSSAKREIR